MYYILENKDYTIKLFWTALAVAVNADDVRGSVSRLSSVQEQSPRGFHGTSCRNHSRLTVFKPLIWLILD